MEIADLISRIGGRRHAFSGVFYDGAAPMGGYEFRSEFEFLRTEEALEIEGGIVTRAGAVPVPFSLIWAFSSIRLHGAHSCRLRSPQLGEVTGPLVTFGEGFSYLGVNASGVSCSVQILFTSYHVFEIHGMVRHPARTFAFRAAHTSQWEQVAKAKVLSMHRK